MYRYYVWTTVTDIVLKVEREVANEHDTNAVVVLCNNQVVGHVPREIST